mgnify:CR=1 FL=1
MVVKAVLNKYTKSEAKDLMEEGQKFVEEKIKGPALKKKEKREYSKSFTRSFGFRKN